MSLATLPEPAIYPRSRETLRPCYCLAGTDEPCRLMVLNLRLSVR
jgi:hypothetical protein